MARKQRIISDILIDLSKYDKKYLMAHFKVSKPTIYKWLKEKRVPITYVQELVELLSGGISLDEERNKE